MGTTGTGTLDVIVLVIVSTSCNRSEFMFRIVFWNCFFRFRMIRDVVPVDMGSNFDLCVFVLDVAVAIVAVPMEEEDDDDENVGVTWKKDGNVSTKYLYLDGWFVLVVVAIVVVVVAVGAACLRCVSWYNAVSYIFCRECRLGEGDDNNTVFVVPVPVVLEVVDNGDNIHRCVCVENARTPCRGWQNDNSNPTMSNDSILWMGVILCMNRVLRNIILVGVGIFVWQQSFDGLDGTASTGIRDEVSDDWWYILCQL